MKTYLAEFKAEQKQRSAKDRKNHHPNEKSLGISYFEAEAGKALLCPCRL